MSQPTVVLVHGAFADASSFGDVLTQLLDSGTSVIAPAVPNRSLNGDAAYVAAVLATVPGPVVLVGHSYGCAVATVAGTADNVASLVYLAGFVPEKGESLGELAGRFPDSDLGSLPGADADPGGLDLSVAVDKFPSVFAADVDPGVSRILAVSQRPLSAAAFEEPAGSAAWHTKPAWGLVATADRTINPDVQRFGYERANVASLEVESSHLVMLSHPDAVSELIVKAVSAVAG